MKHEYNTLMAMYGGILLINHRRLHFRNALRTRDRINERVVTQNCITGGPGNKGLSTFAPVCPIVCHLIKRHRAEWN